ncbi:Hypothetical protein, DUF285 family [Metamycoplasma auris 15026]|uniref:Uncharacterized protein n=1 Tax=Metamycoplasma auris 15026 TaxID=1188233 RepID=N9UZG4_9BACT|nr:BspA family leucine-rich repeat surface protein [Metamycoplasma auris]ENY68572.1 Hypothetical protein, DUF285 family [Metamycoplasma auris 15026]
MSDSSSSNINEESSNSNIQGDEGRAETEVGPTPIVPETPGSSSDSSSSSNSSSNNNGGNSGNYSGHANVDGMISDSPAASTKEDEIAKKEAKYVETVKEIVKEHKDAFAAFHTQGDFLDQIAVYANEKGISGLQLQNEGDKKTNLSVDEEGKGNNKIALKLGSHDFLVELGRVLEKAVVTKYYVKGKLNDIKDNYLGRGETKIEANWGFQMKDHEVVITQLGYHKDHTGIKLTTVGKKTIEVPKHLPLKIESLNLSFYNLESDKIQNLDQWDTKNLKRIDDAFLQASNFSQDLSNWAIQKGIKVKGAFKSAKAIENKLDKIAKSWSIEDKNILTQ